LFQTCNQKESNYAEGHPALADEQSQKSDRGIDRFPLDT